MFNLLSMCIGYKRTQQEDLPSYTESILSTQPKNFIMDDTFYEPNSMTKASNLVNLTIAKPKIIENVNVVNCHEIKEMLKK